MNYRLPIFVVERILWKSIAIYSPLISTVRTTYCKCESVKFNLGNVPPVPSLTMPKYLILLIDRKKNMKMKILNLCITGVAERLGVFVCKILEYRNRRAKKNSAFSTWSIANGSILRTIYFIILACPKLTRKKFFVLFIQCYSTQPLKTSFTSFGQIELTWIKSIFYSNRFLSLTLPATNSLTTHLKQRKFYRQMRQRKYAYVIYSANKEEKKLIN